MANIIKSSIRKAIDDQTIVSPEDAIQSRKNVHEKENTRMRQQARMRRAPAFGNDENYTDSEDTSKIADHYARRAAEEADKMYDPNKSNREREQRRTINNMTRGRSGYAGR